MRKRFAILAAACSISLAGYWPAVAHAQVRPAAAQQADVPVKQIVLFGSGVGYFEHFGSVKGNATTELRFKTDQVNDMLKSLLLQDMDGGKVSSVTYPGQLPLAHMLKSFQIDITANPNMAELLGQLRGAKLSLSMGGSNKLTGTILGVEKKQKAVGNTVVEVYVVNLKTDRQFRSIPLDDVQSMELEDPKLQHELDEALGALAQSRDQDKKPMTLHFDGVGERRVRIGYVVETPVWKTSYRLVLDDTDVAKEAPGKDKPHGKENAPGHPATQPAADHPANGGGVAKAAHHDAKLQGWAIVENQTDNDWKDVQLSLVSGRPLAFIEDLYHAMYIPRPVVEPENFASLQPQTYAGGYSIRDLTNGIPDFTDAPDFSLNSTKNAQGKGGMGGGGGGGGNGLFSGGAGKEKEGGDGQRPPRMDPTSSIISAASAAKVGELFQYTIGNVSLARDQSAMIPIVTDDIDAERLSIYNTAVLPAHPLLGARLKNNTKKYLLQGPVTVLDRGSYAGDARIEDLPPGQERMISYGIDQQVLVDSADASDESSVVTGSIIKGVLVLTMKHVLGQTYIADNSSDDAKTLVIEHPRQSEFKLSSPAMADETTPALYRFRRVLEAHKIAKLKVVQEQVSLHSVAIVDGTRESLTNYATYAVIPQNVRDALLKAVQMKLDRADVEQHLIELHQSITEIGTEQSRIRENMKTVSADSDYYKRLVKKLDDQESAIEKTQKQIAEAEKTRGVMQQQLMDYLKTLNVQ